MRLHHVQVCCPPGGEEVARRFWADGLGMVEVDKPEPLRGRGGAWFRAYDDAGAVTCEVHVGVEDPHQPVRKGHPALLLADLAALDAAAGRLRSLGFEVDDSERDTFPGYARLHARDGYGNRVELLARPSGSEGRAGGGTASGAPVTSLTIPTRGRSWRLPVSNVRSMPSVLDLWKTTTRLPQGQRVFSTLFAQKAPYFASIRPRFTVLEPNRAELVIRKRRGVHNHIGTVHAIALCNGLEAAMGALAEVTIPPGKRWIPKGMEVSYTAKADSDVTCIAETDPEQWTSGDPDLPVRVRGVRRDGTVVIEGEIRLWVTEKR